MTKTFTILSSALLATALSAQGQVIFQETFDGVAGSTTIGTDSYTFPAGWVLINADNRTPDPAVAYINNAWVRREDFANNVADSAAFSTSWYTPAGAADDWMWSPPVALSSNCVLSWNALAYDPDYLDGYEVRVWTAGGNPTAVPAASTVLQAVAAENSTWTNRQVSLLAYAGQTVRIGFRNNSFDKFLLLIDDVTITQQTNFDAEITNATWPSPYTIVPVSQIQPLTGTATIKNSGLQNITGVGLEVDVFDGGANYLGTVPSASTSTLTPGQSANFSTIAAAPPVVPDVYYFDFWAVLNETDGIDANNNWPETYYQLVDPTMYARDDAQNAGNLGIGAGNGGFIGQMFEIFTPTYLDSVLWLVNQGYASTAQPTRARVYNTTAAGVPNQQIGQTVTGTYATDDVELIELAMEGGPLFLPVGKYVIAVEEFDSTLFVAYSNSIFSTGATWVNWPTIPSGTWTNLETFNFNVSLIIRAIINDNPVGLQQADAAHTLAVWPNPATENLMVRFNNSVAQQTNISLVDVSGRTVYTEGASYVGDTYRAIDVSTMAPGVYMLQVSTPQWSKVERVVIK